MALSSSPDRPQTKDRVNFSTYHQDYYTGSQVRVFFGGIWVDDIATIQYQTSHSKTPLFGYNDHQFRTVVKGQLMVNGNFTLAFKETGYLRIIMDLIKGDNSGLENIRSVTGDNANRARIFMEYINQGLTPEQALDITASLDKSTTFNTNAKGGADFEDIAEVMEDAIWGKRGTPADLQKSIPRSDELDYNKYTGNTDKNAKATDIDRNGFDILLTFGDYRFGREDAEHTMISINDVHITGESLIVTPAGEPVGITYNFFARGLNEKVSQAWPVADQIVVEDAKNPDSNKSKKEKQNDEDIAAVIEGVNNAAVAGLSENQPGRSNMSRELLLSESIRLGIV